ncbi:helix-turn-helix domain-containing protein [Empedobacter tilapiae]|uniref:Helix-turn-helix domain-containing protein n=1 Tax=Empedobacter tilapiae TaxID=2491114 RepID=A0A4Z1B8V3_9FLAO|nr:helix-turn-helix domain-containing protein [Empedobacter tilapiae]TGN27876.1 helix-turn-helix domain-containing protein [Empedobacter tilapiae]
MIQKIDYKTLYTDILIELYPERLPFCQEIMNKKILSVLDILELNRLVFGEQHYKNKALNQKFKSYSEQDILLILDYQKKHKLNDSQLANHFKLSRNTVAKWKKIYL